LTNTTQIAITHNLVLNWRFTLVLIKMNYGQIGDKTGLFNTTNPVFYTSGNRFVRRTGTFGNLIFSLVPSDNRNTRSTCLTSVSCLLAEWNQMKKLYRRSYIDASCQVWLHFAKQFQRRFF
jgi:hypothetical protein